MSIQEPTTIQLAHFDMAGTTIDDEVGIRSEEFDGGRLPIMIDGFQYGLKKVGVDASFDDINKHRGAKKIEALNNIIAELRPDVPEDERIQMADKAHDYFIERGVELAGRVQTKEGVLGLYKTLKDGGVYVVAATGFPDAITEALDANLGWTKDGYVDLVMNAKQAGGGRPAPNMINYALKQSGLLTVADARLGEVVLGFDYSVVMKVGDTVKDVQEGLGVGALTIATLEGTQLRKKICSKGDPDYIVNKTRDIVGLIDAGKIELKPYNTKG